MKKKKIDITQEFYSELSDVLTLAKNKQITTVLETDNGLVIPCKVVGIRRVLFSISTTDGMTTILKMESIKSISFPQKGTSAFHPKDYR